MLNTDLGSDLDEEGDEESTVAQVVSIERDSNEEETIKPIVRTEGTKVYRRKSAPERQKVFPELNVTQLPIAPLEQINQPTLARLENLGLNKQLIHGLPNKQYVNVKVGDKMMRVQKFIVSKAEVEAMAREGKLELGGDNILLKVNKNFQPSMSVVSKTLCLDNIIDGNKPSSSPKMIVKKTYAKKVMNIKLDNLNDGTSGANITLEDATDI